MNLIDYSKNVNSQFGEDGILAKVLELVPNRDHWCVEFGAWDGRFLSNTCRLIEEEEYSAVLIEGDRGKFEELRQNFSSQQRVIPLHQFVGFEKNTLDEILSKTPIPKGFDFISIDIDGCDYHIWESLVNYHPKVVCVEFNPTIANGIHFVQARDFSVASGASLDALVALGSAKGYELVAVTRNNGIFVKREIYPLFGISSNSAADLRTDTSWVSHVVCGYDGELIITGANLNPWNGIQLSRMIRQLPQPIRVFPSSMGFFRRKLLGLWKKLFRLVG